MTGLRELHMHDLVARELSTRTEWGVTIGDTLAAVGKIYRLAPHQDGGWWVGLWADEYDDGAGQPRVAGWGRSVEQVLTHYLPR